MAESVGERAAELFQELLQRREQLFKRNQELLQRREELVQRISKLAAGLPVTEDDVKHATRRADEAQEHSREAHRLAIYAHAGAAAAHQRAADAHELAVQEAVGDTSAHQRAAEREREAAHRELEVAEALRRRHTAR